MQSTTRAGAYLRVSQDPSQGGRSVGAQWSDAQRVAKSLGWDLDRQYEDTGSASVYGRKRGVARGNWDRLIADIKAGEIRGVVLAEMSRGTRDLGVYVQLAEIAAEAGCLIAAGGRVFDLSTSSDFMMAALEIVFADAEARRISERVKRGVRGSVLDGRPPSGRCPFGYYRPPRQAGDRVTQLPHPRHASVVRASARYVILGGSLSKISRYWQKLAPDGATFAPNMVRKALLNPVYLGLRSHKGDVTGPGNWPPLLDAETFYRVHDLLTAPERRLATHTNPTTLLSGTLRCGECGGGMYRGTRNGHESYRCPKGHAMRSLPWIERLASELGAAILAAALRDALQGRLSADLDADDDSASVAAADNDLQHARRQLAELIESLPTLGLGAADAAAMVRTYRKTVDDAEQRIKELAAQHSGKRDETAQQVRDLVSVLGGTVPDDFVGRFSGSILDAAHERWEASDLLTRRGFLRDNIEISTRRGGKRLTPATLYVAPRRGWEWLGEYAPEWSSEVRSE